MTATLDKDRLTEALALAENAIGLSDPNPRVGCVIGRADGSILGKGFTQRAGEAHAEVMALREAQASGADTRGATAWVTLEPCAHHGRTPPCCDALIAAGVARVVVAMVDPFPQVAGAGLAKLRAAGVELCMGDELSARTARELNIGFVSRMERGRPWVRLKSAASLDGRTALPNGASQWITGVDARIDGHRWRKRAGAIVTGIGTVLADDPRLDVRQVQTATQPMRVIIDSNLRVPPNAKILVSNGAKVLIAAVTIDEAKRSELEDLGARVEVFPDSHRKVNLGAVISRLNELKMNEIHVEAGPTLSGSFIEANLVDELLLYVAPKLLGEGFGIAHIYPKSSLMEVITLSFIAFDRIGSDIRIVARQTGVR